MNNFPFFPTATGKKETLQQLRCKALDGFFPDVLIVMSG